MTHEQPAEPVSYSHCAFVATTLCMSKTRENKTLLFGHSRRTKRDRERERELLFMHKIKPIVTFAVDIFTQCENICGKCLIKCNDKWLQIR